MLHYHIETHSDRFHRKTVVLPYADYVLHRICFYMVGAQGLEP